MPEQLTVNIGGGAYSKTFMGRVVYKADGSLAKAQHIKTKGSLDLACSLNQGWVMVEIGDYIVKYSGVLPADQKNPEFHAVWRHIDTVDNFRALAPEEIPDLPIPEKVLKGLNTFNNRDGRYFVADEEVL